MLRCGGIAAGLVGLVVGLPALRMRGLYLALITLMAAGGFQVIVGGTGFPDGGSGFLGSTFFGSAAPTELVTAMSRAKGKKRRMVEVLTVRLSWCRL